MMLRRRQQLVRETISLLLVVLISPALFITSQPPIQVHFEATSDHVVGWVSGPSDIKRNLQIFIDNHPSVRIFSPLLSSSVDGCSSTKFHFDVPISLPCGDNEVSVYLMDDEVISSSQRPHQLQLMGSRHVHKQCNPSSQATEERHPTGAIKRGSPPTGQLEQATLYELLGTASDPDNPASALKLSVFVDGAFFTSFMSNGSSQTFTYRIGMLFYEGEWLPLPPSGLPLGSGNHVINVYVYGVDATGQPDGLQTELTGSPVTLAGHEDEYVLVTPDQQLRIAFRANYGGSITSIHDNTLPYNNLIDDDTSGALFQTAFWVLPLHPVLPPNCEGHGNTGPALLMDNPTQGGHPNGYETNPIGFVGTTNETNPVEFIQWEDGGQVLHFKKKYINYNYCLGDPTPLTNLTIWDTDFYLEQWASWDTTYNRTLKLRSTISYVGPSSYIFGKGLMAAWALPTIFAANLPFVFWEELEIPEACNGTAFTSRGKWAAMFDQQSTFNASGIGCVYKPTTESVYLDKLFLCEPIGSGAQGEYVTELSGFLPALESFGDLIGVNRTTGDHYQFAPNGTFSWTTYHPIGPLSTIRSKAQALQMNWPTSPNSTTSTSSGTSPSLPLFSAWLRKEE